MFEGAGGGDGARVGLAVKAFNEAEVGLGVADYIAEADGGRIAREGDAAGAPRVDLHVLMIGEGLDDADEVVFGDTVGLADFLRGDHAAGVSAEIDQNAESIVSMKGELHESLTMMPQWG